MELKTQIGNKIAIQTRSCLFVRGTLDKAGSEYVTISDALITAPESFSARSVAWIKLKTAAIDAFFPVEGTYINLVDSLI